LVQQTRKLLHPRIEHGRVEAGAPLPLLLIDLECIRAEH
jgi:hypothetical protein